MERWEGEWLREVVETTEVGEGLKSKGGRQRETARGKCSEGAQDPASLGPDELHTPPGQASWRGNKFDLGELGLKCMRESQAQGSLSLGRAGEARGRGGGRSLELFACQASLQ